MFVWIPSQIDIFCSDNVDALAKAACHLPPSAPGVTPPLSSALTCIKAAAHFSINQALDLQGEASTSIRHYDSFRCHRYKHRRRGIMVRGHIVVSARRRLGYRPVWQVAGLPDAPHIFSCPTCVALDSNTLKHHCLHCLEVDDLLPEVSCL